MEGNFLTQSLQWALGKWSEYISPIVMVREYEAGVVLKWGQFEKPLKKGINWKFPYPFHEVHKCVTRPETIVAEITITTVDLKTLQIEAKGEFEISDERKWLLGANDALSNIKDLFPGYVSDVATDCTFEDLNKKPVKTKIRNKVNDELQGYGIKFNKILFSKIALTTSISLSGASASQGKSELML